MKPFYFCCWFRGVTEFGTEKPIATSKENVYNPELAQPDMFLRSTCTCNTMYVFHFILREKEILCGGVLKSEYSKKRRNFEKRYFSVGKTLFTVSYRKEKSF